MTKPHSCVVVGIDFSSASRKALDVAVGFSRGLGARRGLALANAYPGERKLWLESSSELAHHGKWP